MKIALAQLNPIVGDLDGNRRKIIDFHTRAVASGAELVVYPELALIGYPPLDLLDRPGFISACESAIHQLARELNGAPALVGCVLPNSDPDGRPVYNTAALLANGEMQSIHIKTRLPSYDVFDEDRYFEPATQRTPAEIGGARVGVTICEDIWEGPEQGRRRYKVDPVKDLEQSGIDLLINLSASPFHAGRGKQREEAVCALAKRMKRPVLLVNLDGFWDPLLALLAHQLEAGYIRPQHAGLYRVVESIESIFDALDAAPPPSRPADSARM